jgi:hypothetical protein
MNLTRNNDRLMVAGRLSRRPASLAMRLRRETTLTIWQIVVRLHLGSWKSLNNKLYLRSRSKGKRNKV